MARLSLPLLVVLAACSNSSLFLGEELLDGAEPVDPGLCGFEDGDLSGFGLPGETEARPDEGGKVQIVEQGSDWSALEGEEDLPFHGERALLIRSNDLGDVFSVGVITTMPFVPRGPAFVLDQVSEVGGDGIALELRVLDAAGGDVLEQHEATVDTGGFVPELGLDHEPIEGFPEITRVDGSAGTFVRQTFDLTRYARDNRRIQVQIRQHTRVQDNGFFTVVDNLCDGYPAEL